MTDNDLDGLIESLRNVDPEGLPLNTASICEDAAAAIIRLRRALATDARVEEILGAILTPSGDPGHGTRDHLPRVLRDYLSEQCAAAFKTGWDDGYAEGEGKQKARAEVAEALRDEYRATEAAMKDELVTALDRARDAERERDALRMALDTAPTVPQLAAANYGRKTAEAELAKAREDVWKWKDTAGEALGVVGEYSREQRRLRARIEELERQLPGQELIG